MRKMRKLNYTTILRGKLSPCNFLAQPDHFVRCLRVKIHKYISGVHRSYVIHNSVVISVKKSFFFNLLNEN